MRILVGKTPWYLDMVSNWRAAHSYDPNDSFGDFRDKIIGGETMMWGEMVDEVYITLVYCMISHRATFSLECGPLLRLWRISCGQKLVVMWTDISCTLT